MKMLVFGKWTESIGELQILMENKTQARFMSCQHHIKIPFPTTEKGIFEISFLRLS